MKITRGGFVPLDVGHTLVSGTVSTAYAWAIPRASMAYKPAVKHYMLTDGSAAVLGAAYFANCMSSMDGVIYKMRWRDFEPSTLGVYTPSALDTAVSYTLAQGKKLILRLWWKSYTDANDPPLNPPLPAYIVSDHATYGGVAGVGGLRKVYTLPTWAGWGAMLEQPAVRDRFYALIDYITARYGSSVAFSGMGPDESVWGASYPLPAELTTQNVIDVNKEMLLRMKQGLPADKVVVQWANYIDSGSISQVSEYMEWGNANNLGVGITDVFGTPQRAGVIQHAYYQMPMASRLTITCVEGLSYGADDGTLAARMDDNYRSAAYLGPDIVGWANILGAAGAYWPHVLRVTGRS